MIQIIAHRGSSIKHPENTAAAFAAAIDAGTDALEVDVRRSSDGVLYCFHDITLRRLTGVHGSLEETPSARLDTLLVRGKEKLLRFSEFLRLFGDRAGIVLDIKSAGIEPHLLEEIGKADPPADLIFSSFSPSVLQKLRELDSESRLALIVGPWRNLGLLGGISESLIEKLRRFDCQAAHIQKRLATSRSIEMLRAAGFSVSVWTLDDPARAADLESLGIRGVITNDPERMRSVATR